MKHLFHEASLAITVSVLLGVQLVHESRLLVFSGIAVTFTTNDAVSADVTIRSGKTSAMGGRSRVEVTMLVVVGASVRGSVADVTEATSCATSDVLGNTLEFVVALLTAAKNTTLGFELVHSHSGQSSGLVVGGSVVVNLVNRNSGVYNVGLNNLLVHHGLNGLVDVVVDVFTSDRRCHTLALGGSLYTPLILELCLFLNKVPLRGVVVAVVEFTVLDSAKLSLMLLREDLTVNDGLNSAVVVILVDLLVYSGVDLFVYVRLDSLVGDSGSNSLMNCGVMVARTVGEVSESCLDFVHFDVRCVC